MHLSFLLEMIQTSGSIYSMIRHRQKTMVFQ